jgi:hypothetical protein
MVFRSLTIALVLAAASTSVNAQVFIEASPVGTAPGGAIIVYGMGGSNPRIPYERIKGSPFYRHEWRQAYLLDPSGRSLGRHDTRLNLVTHEVHFIDAKGMELAANDGTVSQVIFRDTVEGRMVQTVFRNDFDAVSAEYARSRRYAQIMNEGDLSLLKVMVRTGIQADSLFGTQKRYYFSDRNDYFLMVDKRVERIRKLGADELSALLPSKLQDEAFIRENRLKLTREADMVRYIDHLNGLRKSQNP